MLSNTPPCAQAPLPDRRRGHVKQRRDARVPAGREFHKMFPPLHEGVNGGAVLETCSERSKSFLGRFPARERHLMALF
jgi:hypothetical protein